MMRWLSESSRDREEYEIGAADIYTMDQACGVYESSMSSNVRSKRYNHPRSELLTPAGDPGRSRRVAYFRRFGHHSDTFILLLSILYHSSTQAEMQSDPPTSAECTGQRRSATNSECM